MHYLDQWTTRKLGNNSFYSDWEISLTYDKNGNLLTNLTEGYDCINDYIGKETYSYNAWDTQNLPWNISQPKSLSPYKYG